MSGLDGLGWPNPEDEPKPKKTMNSQLKIKLAPTPETDAAIRRYTVTYGMIGKYVRANFARKLERERDEAWEQRDAVTLRLGNTQERMFDAEMQRDRLIKSVEPLKYWRDISECDCSNPLPQGGCLRCDLNRILKTTNPNEL